jgi:hypothetical protein
MQVITVGVAVLVAVGGWIVNGVLDRRGTRRDMRVQYLVSAYRSLDQVSNRPISIDNGRRLEEAIADIILLGNARQVDLANGFTQAFAADGHADTSSLLESLRTDLRKELLLGDAARRTTWLRVESGRQWAEETARVRAGLASELPPTSAPARVPGAPNENAGEGNLHLQVIIRAFSELERALINHLPDLAETDCPLNRAVDERLVSRGTAQAIEGLTIMRDLALQAPERLSATDADEFTTLVKATSYAIRTEGRRSTS